MKLKYLIAVLVISFIDPAFGQQPSNRIDEAMKAQLGELTFNNTILLSELKRVTEENTKLKAELEELKKANGGADAKQKP